MSDDMHDPEDLLRSLRPARSDNYLAPGEDDAADALLRRITTTIPVRRRRRWKRITFFVTGATVLVGAGVTTAVLRSRAPEDPTILGCYSTIEDDAVVEFILPNADRNAIESCAELWTDGTFGHGEVPQLAACVTKDDFVVVLPASDGICAERGSEVAILAEGETADPATELQSLLSERFGEGCLTAAQAVGAVQQILEELGVFDWKTDASRAVDGCNTIALEPRAKTVAIVERP
jgi:hypothetical protein